MIEIGYQTMLYMDFCITHENTHTYAANVVVVAPHKKKTKKNIHTFNDSRQRTRMAPAVDVQVVATPAALLADPPLCSAIDRLGVLSAEVPPDVS
jgi:hypothetical protein